MTSDLATVMEELQQGRRWVRNYTGVWHLCSKGVTETWCGRWLLEGLLLRLHDSCLWLASVSPVITSKRPPLFGMDEWSAPSTIPIVIMGQARATS